MSENYRLVIYMQPNFHDSPNKPYFWYIEHNKANCGFGWAATSEQAFIDGSKYLKEWVL